MRDFLNLMEVQGYFKPDRWNKTESTYTFETGSIIEFFSVDQPGKVRGPRRDRLFGNEINNWANGLETFEQLEVRTKEFVILDWNPTTEFWYYESVAKRPDVDHVILTYKDNEGLSSEIVKSIEQRKDRKGWWTVYGLGLLGEIEGRIYTGWNLELEEVPFEARLECRWLDFGFTNDPSAIGEVYYYNGGWILNERLYRKGMSNKQLADFLLALDKPQTLIIADSAEPKSIAELAAYGLNIVGCKKGKDSVNAGIQLVQDQPITVTKSSINIIKEYRNYIWMTDKNGKIINEEDPGCANHHMAGIRYALETKGRIKQEVSYWDRIYKEELNPQLRVSQINKGQ